MKKKTAKTKPTLITVTAKVYKPKSKPTKKGIKVEKEHTTSKKLAGIIAGNHLDEDKKYYQKLEKIEKQKKKGKK